jgi:hypothetical protein
MNFFLREFNFLKNHRTDQRQPVAQALQNKLAAKRLGRWPAHEQ